ARDHPPSRHIRVSFVVEALLPYTLRSSPRKAWPSSGHEIKVGLPRLSRHSTNGLAGTCIGMCHSYGRISGLIPGGWPLQPLQGFGTEMRSAARPLDSTHMISTWPAGRPSAANETGRLRPI